MPAALLPRAQAAPARDPAAAPARPPRAARALLRVGQARAPRFYMKHVLLPHGPYQYLPSGKQTRNGYQDPVPGMNSPPGFGDRFLTQHNQQRLQLQIGLRGPPARPPVQAHGGQRQLRPGADRGHRRPRLRVRGGVKDRRTVTRRNIDEIAPGAAVRQGARPAPRAHRARTYARTIDVVPTMADVLNFKMPYRADGRSAFSRSVRRRRFVRMIKRNFNGTITVSARRMEARRRANVRAKLRLFGSGRHPHALHGHRPEPRAARPHRRRPEAGRPGQRARLGRAAAANLRTVRAVLAAAAHPDRRARARRQARSQARHRGGRERPHRGGGADLLPARQQAGELRGERARGGAEPGRNTVEVFQVSRGQASRSSAARRVGRGEARVGLGARVAPHLGRLLVGVDEQAEVAPAVVAGDADAEEAVAEPDRVRGLQVAPQLLVAPSARRRRAAGGPPPRWPRSRTRSPAGWPGPTPGRPRARAPAASRRPGPAAPRARSGAELVAAGQPPGEEGRHRADQHQVAERGRQHADDQVGLLDHRRRQLGDHHCRRAA